MKYQKEKIYKEPGQQSLEDIASAGKIYLSI